MLHLREQDKGRMFLEPRMKASIDMNQTTHKMYPASLQETKNKSGLHSILQVLPLLPGSRGAQEEELC